MSVSDRGEKSGDQGTDFRFFLKAGDAAYAAYAAYAASNFGRSGVLWQLAQLYHVISPVPARVETSWKPPDHCLASDGFKERVGSSQLERWDDDTQDSQDGTPSHESLDTLDQAFDWLV